MFSYIGLSVLALMLYFAASSFVSFQRNLAAAKRSGIHYVVVPVYYMQRWWLIGHRGILSLLAYLPDSMTNWADFTIPDFSWDYGYEIYQRVGHDTFLTVAPGGIAMFTCEPAVISQITMRRNDFPKPTFLYSSIDIYGKNVVSSEGASWRQHRKATAPPFTEKNNHLVWTESIDQARKMLSSWVGADGKGDQPVNRVMDDTMRLSLHVISRAGFGRKIEWPAADAKEKVDANYVDYSKIRNEDDGIDPGHSMSYTYAIHCLLDNILFQFLIPRRLLNVLPFARAKKAAEAYDEFGSYMKEAMENKLRETESGTDNKSQVDILGQLARQQLKDSGDSTALTGSEILGNMFVLILAGHETTANSIHFAMIYLALYPQSQRLLQHDLDRIFQGRPPSEWDYDQDLPSLFGGMAGAVLAEELRLIPPVVGIPKSTYGVSEQRLTVEGKSCIVPARTLITLATTSAHRHPKYWPTGKPRQPGGRPAHPVSNIDNDLEEFRPERWIISDSASTETSANGLPAKEMPTEAVTGDGLGVNEAADTSDKLFRPVKGSYLPFSEGYRSCLGRRFAQVEVLAVLAVIFQNYSVELAVDEDATDEQLKRMTEDERADVWQHAARNARSKMLYDMGVMITIQLRNGHVSLRLVPRGEERFPDDVDEIWKKNHPEESEGNKARPAYKCWKSHTRPRMALSRATGDRANS